jgi:hypothetical protein
MGVKFVLSHLGLRGVREKGTSEIAQWGASWFLLIKYYLASQIQENEMRWPGNVAYAKERRSACGILVGKSEVIRPLGRLRSEWENNFKMDRKVIQIRDVDWIDLAQDRNKCRAVVKVIKIEVYKIWIILWLNDKQLPLKKHCVP